MGAGKFKKYRRGAIETQPRVSPALTPRKPLGNGSPRAGPRPERGVNDIRRKKEELVIGFELVYRLNSSTSNVPMFNYCTLALFLFTQYGKHLAGIEPLTSGTLV